jgi:hypothetical protein
MYNEKRSEDSDSADDKSDFEVRLNGRRCSADDTDEVSKSSPHNNLLNTVSIDTLFSQQIQI